MLEQGVTAWNAWRERQPDVCPDLAKADLVGRKLQGIKLCFANVEEADLSQSDLTNSDLRSAKLMGANLCAATLSGTDATEANFSGAQLLYARLVGANLTHANFGDAKVWSADLTKANLFNACLKGIDLVNSHLREANLALADLEGANLKGADLSEAILTQADLSWARLTRGNVRSAKLSKANLSHADLCETDFSGADLSEANLTSSVLIKTRLVDANISRCRIYGISAWGITLKGATQSNLVITDHDEPTITVDNLEVGQFIYLLLHNEKIRHLIDTITSKVVLVLGRFTPERKAILDAIRDELQKRDYSPVVFDFEKPANRDLTETISILAHMARFVIADITEAKSIPQELERIVPDLPSVPVQPILLASQQEYSMFEHCRRYSWVLEPVLYQTQEELLAHLEERVIIPAENKAKEQLATTASKTM
jgi:uncharacterized protein YjbI with pentapeptide repeats